MSVGHLKQQLYLCNLPHSCLQPPDCVSAVWITLENTGIAGKTQILSTLAILSLGSYPQGANAKQGCEIPWAVTCWCTEEEERMKFTPMSWIVPPTQKKSPGVGAFSGSAPCFHGGLQKSYYDIFMTGGEYSRLTTLI